MELDTTKNAAHDAESLADDYFDQVSIAQSVEGQDSTKRSGAARVNVRENEASHQQARWLRLSKYYSDKYLDFFIKSQDIGETDGALFTSQYGSVTWTGQEKDALFRAVSTKGRHNLPDLAVAVQTKSVVEIKDYLDRVKTADGEHQMFAPHVKNASLDEIDAAVEINTSWEERLEKAADALAAFQDKYDLAKVRGDGELWLIDTVTADVIDEENEVREMSEAEHPESVVYCHGERDKGTTLFRFGTMLQLSRSLFMNTAEKCEHDHWTAYAEDGEEPSLTVDAAQVFHNLVKSLTQRVLQTAVFLARSRIRSATRSDYTPREVLKDIDVIAALNVLGLPADSWGHWTKFARRSGVQVILGDHKKGQNDPLTLEQIESTLSIRSTRGRRRSLSSIVSQSSQENLSDPEDEVGMKNTGNGVHQSVEEEASKDMSSGEHEDGQSVPSSSDVDSDRAAVDGASSMDDNTTADAEHHVSRKRRRIMMEELQDEYLDKLDRAAQLREENVLQESFGFDTIKEEPVEDLPGKPRGQRKAKEDLKDWTETVYYSQWEVNQLLDDDTGSPLGENA